MPLQREKYVLGYVRFVKNGVYVYHKRYLCVRATCDTSRDV